MLPCAVPLAEVIARNEKVAIGIAGALAYNTGFELKIIVLLTKEAGRGLDPFGYEQHFAGSEGGLPPEMLRLGIEYADGRKAMNTNFSWAEPEDDERDEGRPTMVEHGGGGGEREWRQDFGAGRFLHLGPCSWSASGPRWRSP